MVSEVVAGLGQVAAGLDAVSAGLGRVVALTDGQVRDAIVAVEGLVARVEAVRLRLVRASVYREPEGRGRGRVTRAVLQDRCRRGRGTARADLVGAEVTDPQVGVLRRFGVALAAGEVSARHLDVARRAVHRIPRELLEERRVQIDEVLTGHALQWSPEVCATLAEHLVAVLDPDRAERQYADACTRRGLAVGRDAFGMTLLKGQLDEAAGLQFRAVLDHLVNTGRGRVDAEGVQGEVLGVPVDTRTASQRRADALT